MLVDIVPVGEVTPRVKREASVRCVPYTTVT